jgi:glycine cleavage system H lipoate-binding protein
MRCPFLREAQVKFCRASAFRKMIVRLPGQPDNERCSSPDYMNCPAARQHHEERPLLDHCPFLNESLVQYCSAGSVTKYIPYSESLLSQCGTESHKYCEAYLGIAHPITEQRAEASKIGEETNEAATMLDGVQIHEGLWYSPNHMWLDVSPDGLLHVGVDAFLAKIFGTVDAVSFVTTKGLTYPTVVLSLHGADLQLMFPNQMVITRTNSYLRTTPSKIVADPYTVGWLFEGTEYKNSSHAKPVSVTHGLISGLEAGRWMRDELTKANSLAHLFNSQPQENDTILMADGGVIQAGFLQHLHREETLQVFNTFFSPLAHWRKTQ